MVCRLQWVWCGTSGTPAALSESNITIYLIWIHLISFSSKQHRGYSKRITAESLLLTGHHPDVTHKQEVLPAYQTIYGVKIDKFIHYKWLTCLRIPGKQLLRWTLWVYLRWHWIKYRNTFSNLYICVIS